ncbi:MAG: zinc-binding dehydrogenase [Chloroflexi bacterium]|nr:zinc-binding dehydrogenase [Chloroflexota bacterium]
MRIIRLEGKSVVTVVDQADPVPAPGEVVVETAVSALCGSELHTYRGDGLEQGNIGHEAVGTVVAIGEGVSDLKIGQRVGASAIAGCGDCFYCARRQYTWCPEHAFYGSMHAERFLAAAAACYPLPDDISWAAGVLITGDGLGVPYHTSTKIASPDIRTVAVFGVGPIGLGNVLMQAHLGRRVIAVDIVSERLVAAEALGASDVVNARECDPVERVRMLSGGAGVDVCIEAAGRSETALACFEAVRTAGTVVFNGEQGALPISPSDQFIRRDITAVGAWYYHFSEVDQMLELYRNGLPVTNLISHRYPFEEAGIAYEKFSSGQSAKVLLDYQMGAPNQADASDSL